MTSLFRRTLCLFLTTCAAMGSGCIQTIGHFEPALLPPPDAAEYSRDVGSLEVPPDSQLVIAAPVGVRAVEGGLNVDVAFSGLRVSEAFSPGRMADGEPFAPFWVTIGDRPENGTVAELPRRVVDRWWPQVGPAFVDEQPTAILQTTALSGSPRCMIVSIPVRCDRAYSPGETCYVSVLLQRGDELAPLLTEWHHASLRYRALPPRALIVR